MARWVVLVSVVIVCARAQADCPSGSSPQTSEWVHEDCMSGGRITSYETDCRTPDGTCVESWDTLLGKDYPCGNCYCYPEPESTITSLIHVLCGDLVDCGDGKCTSAETCCNGNCIPSSETCCSDGTGCAGSCAGNGHCCPDNLPVFDGASGYCCGQTDPNNPSTVCECANPCAAIQGCCPANTVCCPNGWCAPDASGCPSCPSSAPVVCPDGSCAPAGAVCCGNGQYCPNGLACTDSGGGILVCGSGTVKTGAMLAQSTSAPSPPPGAVGVTRAAQKPTKSKAGTAPTTPASGLTDPLGCKCELGGRARAGWWPFALVLLLLALRRRAPPLTRADRRRSRAA